MAILRRSVPEIELHDMKQSRIFLYPHLGFKKTDLAIHIAQIFGVLA